VIVREVRTSHFSTSRMYFRLAAFACGVSAAVQSAGTHTPSKPRRKASAAVICTHMSVASPASTSSRAPISFSSSSSGEQ
jgi:hypothetical protein